MKKSVLVLCSSFLVFVSAVASAQTDPDFGSYWHDGKAELDGYRWSGVRYGEIRTGQAVLIYVTEPFSKSRFVKVDDPSRNPSDTFDALKLNMVRDFQTGIYDYNTMVSVFTHSEDFRPAKISFTSAEWCGHVYSEILFSPNQVQQRLFSYFEGESDSNTLDARENAVQEDNLFILLRGLRGEFLKAGEKKSFPFLPSPFFTRLAHRPVEWTTAEIERLRNARMVDVPAGRFSADPYVVRISGGREGSFFIERDYPHRVIRWSWNGSGEGTESGELAGSERLEYWKLHGNGQDSYLENLGLKALPK